jgi:malonyl-ACP decarboxylase
MSWSTCCMQVCDASGILITGLGVIAAIGQGKETFIAALLNGESRFDVMKRPGRQHHTESAATQFLGAEIASFSMPEIVPGGIRRTASLTGQVALATLHEAWNDAALADVDPTRIGLVVGGSNLQQRELTQIHEAYREKPQFLRPAYALSFMDSDVCGMCTETFGIEGFAYTLGGASASGQLAVLQAVRAVESGQVDVCIALGALMDLSFWECQGFRSLGAMGSDTFAHEPARACRPFDKRRDGFIFGEACGALVIEKAGAIQREGVNAYARIAGWAMKMDANRNANPSVAGEVSVIRQALDKAGLDAADIDYINTHGTGSGLGDETELQAIAHCGLKHAYINGTKSLTGHGLSAAGAVELVATVLQMRAKRLHPTRNLDDPIDDSYNWVRHRSVHHTIRRALKMSMGFGGVNSALCLERI